MLNEASNIYGQQAGPWISRAEKSRLYKNAVIVLPDGLIKGSLQVDNGLIKDVSAGAVLAPGEDFEGDYVWPGFVELHTDNLEKHIMPRQGTFWPFPEAALEIHDAQLAAAGITTVLDSVCVGEPGQKERRAILKLSLEALAKAPLNPALRVDHLIHLRCELPAPEMAELFEGLAELEPVRLLSLMDHSPGQRQWRDIDYYLQYYAKSDLSPDKLKSEVEELLKKREKHASLNLEIALKYARDRSIPIASHDDTLPEHVQEAVDRKLQISEFPTTMEAARAARVSGLLVVMGAPNLIRGGSHSGNVSALEVAAAGCLDILSSDYVPAGLLSAAWILHEKLDWPIEKAAASISLKPAQAVDLNDRGQLAPGRLADFVRVGFNRGRPFVKEVFAKGRRVF
jgi:alpha-D-ribose 1-methylphosphonate 5-triphosphate diphosphatase